jgi:hypothetical protein
MNEHTDLIDVYPVGWLRALQSAGRCIRRGRPAPAWRFLRQQLRYSLRQARRGNWRAVRNTFGGYHAEHHTLGRRCGTGWTKRRAINDLYRHLAEETISRDD